MAARVGGLDDLDRRPRELERIRDLLRREGFPDVWVPAVARGRGARPADLLATNGLRSVRVFVFQGTDIDSAGTQARIRSAVAAGETRVFVPWTLKWRALSNLDRWGVRGVSVAGW